MIMKGYKIIMEPDLNNGVLSVIIGLPDVHSPTHIIIDC